ncbi:MAG: hypothetical protein EAZ53_10245 [Bacteroidetes bacterium]|nr:MAG: hypothetical protein EAZ53_10245 [Bacteroidota bacterium]
MTIVFVICSWYKGDPCTSGELKVNEKKDYLDRIEKLPEEFTQEGFKSKLKEFGTIAMLTNIESTHAENIYASYKCRNEVEVMFDGFKNDTVLKKCVKRSRYYI